MRVLRLNPLEVYSSRSGRRDDLTLLLSGMILFAELSG